MNRRQGEGLAHRSGPADRALGRPLGVHPVHDFDPMAIRAHVVVHGHLAKFRRFEVGGAGLGDQPLRRRIPHFGQ